MLLSYHSLTTQGQSFHRIAYKLMIAACFLYVLCLGTGSNLRADPLITASYPISDSSMSDSDADEIVIYGTSWGPTLAMDGSGIYNDFARDIFKEAGIYGQYKIGPYNRSKQTFLKQKTGCLYPSAISVLTTGQEIGKASDFVESDSFLLVKSYLFAASGLPAYDGEMTLKDKWVGYPIGSALPKVMASSQASFLAISDEMDKAKLLVAGRIDYMSGSLPDTAFVFQTLKKPMPSMERRHLLFSTGVGVVCHRTHASEAMIKKLNAAFLHQYRYGMLKSYLENAGLMPENYLPKGE